MNWNDIRVFLALRRHNTFAGAGRELGVNATTTARRLDALERSIGTRLFTHTAEGLIPTAAGDAIAEAGELIERQAHLIERATAGKDTVLAGNVTLAVTQSFADEFLLDHFEAFHRAHPGIELELNTSDAMVDLTRGGADLAVRFRPVGAGSGVAVGQVEILARRVSSLGIAVYASRAYLARAGCPASAESVAGHDLVVPRQHATYLPGAEWAQAQSSQCRVVVRCDALASMVTAAKAGYGLCALPTFVALRHPELLRLPAPETIDARETWLLMPSDLRRVARVRAVWDFLLELFTTTEPLLSGRELPPGRVATRA